MEAKDTKEAAQHIADVINVFRIKNATFKPRYFRDYITNRGCLYYDKLHSYMVQNGYIIVERAGKDPLSKFADSLVLGCEVFEEYINWRRGNVKGSVACPCGWEWNPETMILSKKHQRMEKKSFAIPEGCKVLNVSKESGRLVIEFEEVVKFEPKRGDICTGLLYDYSFCFILDGIEGCRAYYHAANASNEATPRTGKDWCDIVHLQRLANEEETAQLFTALEKEGLRWNAETMEVERLRWKPKGGEEYYYFDGDAAYCEHWGGFDYEDRRLLMGNVFKTEAECLAAIEKVKALLLSI